MDKKKQIQKRLEEKRILKGKTTIKKSETYDDPKIVLEIPMAKIKGLNDHDNKIEGELKELYIQLQKMYDTVDKALEKENVNNDKLIEVNNSLVRLQSMLLDKGLRIKNVESLEAATKAAVDNLKDIKVPENLTIKNMPNWLASEKSLDQVNKNLAEISSQMAGLETTPQGQKAEDYVPFRRVVAEGQRLRFDDFIPGSGGGAGGTSTNPSTSLTGSAAPASATYVGLVNTSGNLTGLSAGGNFVDASTLSAQLANGTYVYNGTNWDRSRGTAADGTQVFIKGTATDNGLIAFKLVTAATTNPTSVKASAGKVYLLDMFNSDTVGYWVKMYNKASAPTVGTDVPVASRFVPAGGGAVIATAEGIPFTTGIAFGTTLNATDSDTTVVTTANKLVINIRYV